MLLWHRRYYSMRDVRPMNLDELQGQIRLEIERRMGMLHADADTWTQPARIQKMGLSGSQLVALKDMVEVLEARQQLAFSKLTTGAPTVAFGNGNADMLVEMTGAHELWSTFRTILAQYEDAQLLRAVQSGARIAGGRPPRHECRGFHLCSAF